MGKRFTKNISDKKKAFSDVLGEQSNCEATERETFGSAFPVGTIDNEQQVCVDNNKFYLSRLSDRYTDSTNVDLDVKDESFREFVLRKRFDEWIQTYHPKLGSLAHRIKSTEEAYIFFAELSIPKTENSFRTIEQPTDRPKKGAVSNCSGLDPNDYYEPGALKTKTICTLACRDCNETGVKECVACAGNKKNKCPSCNGQLKYHQLDKRGRRRLMNCKTCKKKGTVDCTKCKTGGHVCLKCRGQKRIESWQEIEARKWRQNIIVQDNRIKSIIKRNRLTKEALVKEKLNYSLVGTECVDHLLNLNIPRSLAEDVATNLGENKKMLDSKKSINLKVHMIPLFDVKYALPKQSENSVVFLGPKMLLPEGSLPQELAATEMTIGFTNWLPCVVPLLAVVLYLSRGWYFVSFGVLSLIALLTLTCWSLSCLLYTSPSPRDATLSRMPSSA